MLCTRNALTANMLCFDIVLYDFIIACIVSYLHNIYYVLFKILLFRKFCCHCKKHNFSMMKI